MSSDEAFAATPPPSHHLARVLDGYLVTQLLYVAAKLGVADALAEGPHTAEAARSSWSVHRS